ASSRSLSFSSSRSRPVRLSDSSTPAEITPMMRTTTRISTSVKPAPARRAHPDRMVAALVAEIPVADIGIDAIAPGLAVGPQGVQVVRLAVRAGEYVQIRIPPRILADPLEVAAGLPVLDRGVGGLLHQCREALLGGGILGVVEVVHGERRLQALDVSLRLGDARVVHLAHDRRNDDRGQQAKDDDDHHDPDEGEAARAPCAGASATLAS